ncbi:MAG: hypothetical protein ACE5LS_02030 [Thermoplasmata archaeon]
MSARMFPNSQITLHVLRHPPASRERTGEAREVARPRGVLREGLERADRAHRGVLREVPATFYYRNATPCVLRISRRAADRLRASLCLQEAVFGVWGPETVRHGDALYEVWVRHHLCG